MPKIDTTVGNLVAMIKNGELRLPEMQRRYVWPATRVRDLLDSLYRGYPSGTILVWETDQEMPSRDLAISQNMSPFKGHKLLLDGQQRLTSLSAVLRAEPVSVRNRKKPIEILFNLDHPEGPPAEVVEVEEDANEADENDTDQDEEEEGPNIQERLKLRTFVVANKALLADRHWVKVSDVFNENKTDVQILKTLVSSFDDPKFDLYSKRLQDVRKIRDYPYVMHVLDKKLSYEEVAEIFVRVNSLGIKLRGSDLALAQITSRWRDSLKLFEGFQEECEEKWFTFDIGVLVRALVVFATGQSKFHSVGAIPLDKLKSSWETTKNGMRFAVNFLRANAGMEDESLLSSPLFAITIAHFAIKNGQQVSPAQERLLKKWLHSANARGHYSRGSSETIHDADLSAINKGGGPAELIELLKNQLGRLEIEPQDFVGRGQRSALFSTAYLALKARGAKDWRTRLGLSLTHQGRYHFIEHHHIFPKAQLKRANYEKAETNEISNMAFITGGTNRRLAATPAHEYLAKVLQEQGKEALENHCIPLDPELWRVENFPKFLEYRRAALATAINEYIDRSPDVGNGQIDLPALLANGEGGNIEFKASARWDVREGKPNKALEGIVAKTVAGFLNGRGGTLLIGVDDTRQVVGLEQDYATLSKRPNKDGYEQFLINLLSTSLGRDLTSEISIQFPQTEGKEVCAVKVGSGHRPVYVQDGQQTRFYLRTGNATQELNTKEANEYIRHRWKN